MNGNFVWFDLHTSDVAAAQRFYTGLLGWTAESGDRYTHWKAGGTGFGGMMALDEGMKQGGVPPHWMGYVGVEHVDAAVARCAELGGRVIMPGTDIPNTGRFAILADPDGAAFAVYGESRNPGESKTPVDWHELMTTDLDAACTFYERMFGWHRTETMDMGPENGTYVMFGVGGKTIGGMMTRPKEVPVSNWTYYFHTDDVLAATEEAKALGAKHLHTTEVPGGSWISLLVDPQGAHFAIHGPKGG